jgi:hypothetical protein
MAPQPRTNFKVWAIVFLVITIPTSFYHMYPDHPLWLAWLLSPLMLFQGLMSREPAVIGHLALLAAAFLILLGSSWVIHCIIIWA